MASLGTLSKWGREGIEDGTSYPTTPPHCQELQFDTTRGKAVAIQAAADELSLPPKKTKLQHGREQPLFATELDAEWQRVYDDWMFKVKTAGAAIDAL